MYGRSLCSACVTKISIYDQELRKSRRKSRNKVKWVTAKRGEKYLGHFYRLTSHAFPRALLVNISSQVYDSARKIMPVIFTAECCLSIIARSDITSDIIST